MRTNLFRGVLALALLLAMSAAPALAQSVVRGKVVDAQGNGVEGATVLFEAEGANRRIETKTDRNGDFLQIGLQSGQYKVTASKEGVGTHTLPARVTQSQNEPLNFSLTTARGAATGDPEAAAIQAAAGAAVEAMRAGRHDEAIERFNEVLVKVPECAECHYNIGVAYASKREYTDAEAAFKKVIEIDPSSADAYTGLANIYNAQKKFAEASEASAKAAELAGGSAGGGGSAEALYNQGVIQWNAGKYDEAKTQFEAAIKADPRMAMAHYQLGMANLNLGQIPEAREAFQKYLEVEPNGARSDEVKTFLEQLPQ